MDQTPRGRWSYPGIACDDTYDVIICVRTDYTLQLYSLNFAFVIHLELHNMVTFTV